MWQTAMIDMIKKVGWNHALTTFTDHNVICCIQLLVDKSSRLQLPGSLNSQGFDRQAYVLVMCTYIKSNRCADRTGSVNGHTPGLKPAAARAAVTC